RGEDYGREVWRRLAPRLAEEPVPLPRRLLTPRRLTRLTVVAAAIAVAFLLGRGWPRTQESIPAAARERIMLAAVGDHLERSLVVLLDFINASPSEEIPERSRERARGLLADNRLLRQTASRGGDAAVASVLDDLERVLLEVAHGAATPESRAA